ncbi:O-antigen ligase family protein [Mesonia sp. K7]|uniref:O-antigen ligase family protein n=1 Tax=Mesonia sp. K7 TaxID=2218606 RepID=UPI000DA9483E|nr:O-antigen ligase family protein [Mesonia sp. K7]PZD79231.1 hypothetical protein DNG35_01715 [Mesonia sp. K7]
MKNTANQPIFKNENLFPLLILTSYFLVELFSADYLIDYKGLHWLLISVINTIALGYIITKQKTLLRFSLFKYNILIGLLTVFLALSSVSIFFAINIPQSISTLVTHLTTWVMAIVFFLLLYKRLALLKTLAVIVTVITFFEVSSEVFTVFKNLYSDNIRGIWSGIKGNLGNKNVFAFSLVMKLPLVIYTLFHPKLLLKVLASITLLLSLICIMAINSKASFLALIIIVLVLLFYLFKTAENRKKLGIKIGIFCGLLILSFLAFNMLDSSIKTRNLKKGTQPTSFVESIVRKPIKKHIRLKYWDNTLGFIADKPITGYGLGNYELYIPQYYNTLTNGNKVSRHPHNEFLHIAAETGLVNMLVYLALIGIAVFFCIKIFLSKDKSTSGEKWFSVLFLCVLIAYFFDCMFNFPMSRPPIQVFFVFALGGIASLHYSEKETLLQSGSKNYVLPIIISALSVTTVYGNYKIYQSFEFQQLMSSEKAHITKGAPLNPKYSYHQISEKMPSFPSIAEDTEPIGVKMANYLIYFKKYNKALKVLDSVQQYSPYTAYVAHTKSIIYFKTKAIDSANAYAKKAFMMKPRYMLYYKNAIAAAGQAGKPEEVKEIYKAFSQYNESNGDAYYEYITALIRLKYNRQELNTLVIDGFKKFPNHQKIQALRTKKE